MTVPEPSPARERLCAELRGLRARTGVSLAGLARETTFSKSSWERYLNGRTLPPRAAVEELCALAAEPTARYLALWELAEAEWGGRAALPAPEPSTPPEDGTPRPDHRRAAVVAALVTACAVIVAALVLALLLLPNGGSPTATSASPTAVVPLCSGAECKGKDPMALRCAAQPDTLADHRTATGAWIELRYSEVCGTSWARMWDTRLGDELTVTPGNRHAQIRTPAETNAYVYTYMTVTTPGTKVQACFAPATAGHRECVAGVVP
ncbi:DUF2690 domain-containing protein [Streptomyces sp. NPDC047072]|uniref:helix-turn-helix domain-containing protein n=1 Tax=Streptomyces sp. NPDC047072 TaxID=3154809 RepID=UPI0033D24CDF